MRQPLVTMTSTARALSQWVSLSHRGWLALGEAVSCDMSGSRLLFVGAEYGSRKIAKSSRKVKLIVITAPPIPCRSEPARDEPESAAGCQAPSVIVHDHREQARSYRVLCHPPMRNYG